MDRHETWSEHYKIAEFLNDHVIFVDFSQKGGENWIK